MRGKARFFFSVPVLIVLAVLAAGVAFIKSDFAAERVCAMLRSGVDERLGIEVQIDRCAIDLLPPALETQNVRVQDGAGGQFLQTEGVRVELDSLSLLAGDFQVDRVTLRRPQVHLRLAEGRLVNLPTPKVAAPAEPTGPTQLDLSRLPERVELEGGRLDLVIDRWGLVQVNDLRLALAKGEGDSLQLAFGLGGGQIELASTAGTTLPIKPGQCKAQLNGQVLDLAFCNLDVGEVNLKASGRLALAGGDAATRLNATVSGPLSMIKRLFPDAPAFSGRLVLSADAVREQAGWRASGAIDLEGFGVATISGVNLKSLFEVSPEQATLVSMRLDSAAARLGGKLNLSFKDEWPFSGDVALDMVDLQECLKMGGLHWRYLDVRGPAEAKVKGRVFGRNGWDLEMNARTVTERFKVRADPAGGPVLALGGLSARTDASFNGKRMRFYNSRVEKGETVLEGECRWRFRDWDMAGKVSSSKANLGDLSPIADLNFTGRGGFELDIGGTVHRPEMTALVYIHDLGLEARPVGYLRGKVLLDGADLSFDPMVLSRYGGTVRLDGKLNLAAPFRVNATADLVRIKLPELVSAIRMGHGLPWLRGGLVGGEIQASGNLRAPVLDFRVAFADLLVADQAIKEGGAVGRLEEGAWRLDLLEISLDPGWLFARGAISRELDLDLIAYSTGLKAQSFQALRPLADRLDFRLDMHVGVRGPLLSPALDGWVKVYDTLLAGQALGDTNLTARATAEAFEVKGNILGRVASAQLMADLNAGLPFRGQVDFETEDLGRLLERVGEVDVTKAALGGRLSAQGLLLEPERASADLSLSRAFLQIGQMSLANREPVSVRLRDGRIDVTACQFAGDRTALAITGGGGLKTGPRLSLKGALDLELLPLLTPLVSKVRGQANLLLGVGGTWSEPSWQGSAAFNAGHLRLSFLPVDLADLTGQLQFDPAKLEVTKVRGQAGAGQFTLWGDLNFEQGSLGRMALTIELDRVRYQASKQLWGIGSGTLTLSHRPDERLQLSGQLLVHEGGFEENISLVSFSDGIFRRRRPRARTYQKKDEIIDFDVRLIAPGQFRALYNLDLAKFQAEMKGDLRLTGTNQRLGVIGELDALNGSVSYLSKEFGVDTARVTFESRYSIDPKIEILASRSETVDRGEEGKVNYQIRLGLKGEGDDFRVSLRSTPALDERDIVTLLSLGITSQDMDQLQGDDLVGLGGEIFLRSLKLDERLGKLFPFPPELIQPKYLRMRSRFSNQIDKTTPRLETGVKLRLISEDLDLDYSRSLYYDEDQSLELSYRLTSGVSARLRWEDSAENEYGDLGLDLKLNWEW